MDGQCQMVYKMNRFVLITVCLIIFNGCIHPSIDVDTSQKRETTQLSKTLNDSACNMLQEFYLSHDSALLDNATVLLQEAIRIDSINMSAYSNLAIIFGLKNDSRSVIEVADRMLGLYDNKSYAYAIIIGALYNMKDTTSIDSVCFNAMHYYQERLEGNPSDIVVIEDMIAFLEVSRGLEYAENVLDSCIGLYPTNEILLKHKKRIVDLKEFSENIEYNMPQN